METKPFTVIGIMSGTSLDGVDMAYCYFRKEGEKWIFEIIKAATYKYPETWTRILQEVKDYDAFGLAKAHTDYGHFLGKLVSSFIRDFHLEPCLISSHGHTVFHRPAEGITFQLGSGASLAAETQVPVVCDFRTLDVALGGQGAPLVPIGDRLLFGEYSYCLNLGGFSNISFEKENERLAFDISPCNMALNYYANQRFLPYDDKGQLAEKGKIHHSLFERLNNLEYYSQTGPKSLGREWFEKTFLPVCEQEAIEIPDILCTLTEHIAYQISRATQSKEYQKILITGGGAHNDFLIKRIRALVNHQVIIPNPLIVDNKEALIFAFLGFLRFQQETNVLHSVTGAATDHIGGAVYYR